MFHLEFSKMLTSETLTMNYKIIEEFWKPDMDLFDRQSEKYWSRYPVSAALENGAFSLI